MINKERCPLSSEIIKQTEHSTLSISERIKEMQSSFNKILEVLRLEEPFKDKIEISKFESFQKNINTFIDTREYAENLTSMSIEAIESIPNEEVKKYLIDLILEDKKIKDSASSEIEKVRTFIKNSIPSFVYLLDDILKQKFYHDLNLLEQAKERVEPLIQELLKISGLAEIQVTVGEDKYNATIHEPVRWVLRDEYAKEKDINRDKVSQDSIIALVRRGFIDTFDPKKQTILRRSRVVCIQ